MDRSTTERGYILRTLSDDGTSRAHNKPLKRFAFEKQFGFSPEWPHEAAGLR